MLVEMGVMYQSWRFGQGEVGCDSFQGSEPEGVAQRAIEE